MRQNSFTGEQQNGAEKGKSKTEPHDELAERHQIHGLSRNRSERKSKRVEQADRARKNLTTASARCARRGAHD
jgi:hypothetical protein